MVQIVSDKQTPLVEWITGVLDRLGDFDVSQVVLVAQTTDPDTPQLIEFMNCNTDDMYYFGGVIQKEAVKHEIREELGLDDEDWEEDTDE